jgi:hypothetical protein
MISRSCGTLRARAASTARATSAALTSRSFPEIATTPRLFTPRMCPPATPAYTAATSTRRLLGLAHRRLDRLPGRLDVDDAPLAEAARRGRADAEDHELAGRAGLGDDGADLGRAHVQPNDEVFRSCACYPWPPFVRTT